MTKKSTKRALLSSVIAIFLCFTMLLGTTFAYFTDSATSGSNIIKAGNLDMLVEYTLDGESWNELDDATDLFQKGLWEPGHTELVAFRIKNTGTLALKYTANMNITRETKGKNAAGEDIVLSDILTVGTLVQQQGQIGDIALMLAFGGENKVVYEQTSAFKTANVLRGDVELLPGDTHYLLVKVGMADSVGNEANHNSTDIPTIAFGINILAKQFTYENDSFGNQYDKDATYPELNTVDTWDGTASIDWFLADPTAETFTLSTAEDLAGLAAILDGTAAVPSSVTDALGEDFSFADKEIILESDIDLYREDENGEAICFDPIGSYRNEQVFSGVFDGQGHTISNLMQTTWALDNGYYYSDCGLGLFGAVEEATIKNLVIDGANISGESALCGTVAAVAHNSTFENITVKNANVADYQYYAGGIVGWASGECSFVGCNMDASTNIAAQWGDFDNSIGGVIGGASTSAQILLKDCTVACRIDAYNDVTSSYQWYAYRRAGMLIGNSGSTTTDEEGATVASAPQLTCENVTVIYGDWANYTYCEFAGTSWPYVRVQAGVSNSAYSNPRYGHPTDANGNEVVDDNHVHNDGEDHLIECTFDQLYGGSQGVYGTAIHDGVTVVYNNK